MGKIKTNFMESLSQNERTIEDIQNELLNVAVSTIEWMNLPDTVDERFLEYTLCVKGFSLFFEDEVIQNFLALPCTLNGEFNVYNVPVNRMAYAANGYNKECTAKDSVVIFNNFTRSTTAEHLYSFAKRIWEIERTIDINVFSQKTPVFLLCPENQKLTMENLYKEYSGNTPVIKGYKGAMEDMQFKVLNTEAPFVSDKLFDLKDRLWNEALSFLGVVNSLSMKRERQTEEEMKTLQGRVYANRLSRLYSRKQACNQINEMFGLHLDVKFREPELYFRTPVDREGKENE